MIRISVGNVFRRRLQNYFFILVSLGKIAYYNIYDSDIPHSDSEWSSVNLWNIYSIQLWKYQVNKSNFISVCNKNVHTYKYIICIHKCLINLFFLIHLIYNYIILSLVIHSLWLHVTILSQLLWLNERWMKLLYLGK